ncbi:TPA: hypothetical protein L9K67_005320 [Klebsiella pneumoniae]|nr:hypothetical protein [Klebsiella pneumoniae]
MGAYFGRAYQQLYGEKIKPRNIYPESAVYGVNTIRVKFNVPVKPLVLDTLLLAPTKNYGFTVFVGSTEQNITGVAIESGDTVVITVSAVLSAAPTVRYALDNLGTGLSIINGASGNLRDSSPDTCTVNGEVLPMYYICPHFKINAITNII